MSVISSFMGSDGRKEANRLRNSFSEQATNRMSQLSEAHFKNSAMHRSASNVHKFIAPKARKIMRSKCFQAAMFLALLAALFMPDIWILSDRDDNRDLDVVLSVVLLMFLLELVVQSIGQRAYRGSFFFWMDLLGALSLVLDLSYLSVMDSLEGLSGSSSVSDKTVIMRAARIAKLGARAGRFTRLVKLLRFLPGMREQGAEAGTAKVISGRLINSLSTRVSCLIILMVMVMPLFSMWTYPEQDVSMESWMEILEKTADRFPERFCIQLSRFGAFYDDLEYYPHTVAASTSNLPAAVLGCLPWYHRRGFPKRLDNTRDMSSDRFDINFNFKVPNQVDAACNLALLVAVMMLMVGFSLVLSNSVSHIVLRPLETLLMQVRTMASTIFQSVSDMTTNVDTGKSGRTDEQGENDENLDQQEMMTGNETELLEKVVQKLAVLSEITMTKNVVDAETMEGLGEGDRAVIHGFQGAGQADLAAWGNSDEEEEDDANFESMLQAQKTMVENAGLSLELLDSWKLNPLELDKARNHAAAMYFVGPHNHGISFDTMVMGVFLEAVEGAYLKTCPYHNWFHAIDTTHCVYRFFQLCSAEAYLSGTERYALLVSAVCHDVGHPGLNNKFLIETSHELALRYNDKSPLENMHCARLFEFISDKRTNIFSTLLWQHYQEVRRICIEAILHTDNAQHFAIIREVQMVYEVNSEILDASQQICVEDPDEFPTKEAVECFRLLESRKLFVKLFLHLADLSNSTKPFRICRIWAQQILEECFVQGDAEKKLSIPVQALNDRNQVNRPFSQVGFIEFLVSPLLFTVVKVLPPTEHMAEQLVQNAISWQKHWLQDTQPEPTAAERKALADRIIKLENKLVEMSGLMS